MRKIIVMKFGGTSVADPHRIERACERAIAARRKGFGVVVVASAPGHLTDELIGLARELSRRPDERELDQLMTTGEMVTVSLFAMAAIARGCPAVSLSGPQAGIVARGPHSRARISAVRTGRLLSELRAGKIVCVAGFQAARRERAGEVVTLGRGGSDLTAVALAGALGADFCEIYTDVKGIYTADPRVVPDARKIESMDHKILLELCLAGARVMQAESASRAMENGVALHIRSAFHPEEGTWVRPTSPGREAWGAPVALALNGRGKGFPEELSVIGPGEGLSGLLPRLRDVLPARLMSARAPAVHGPEGRKSGRVLRVSFFVRPDAGPEAARILHQALGLGGRA